MFGRVKLFFLIWIIKMIIYIKFEVMWILCVFIKVKNDDKNVFMFGLWLVWIKWLNLYSFMLMNEVLNN